MSAKPRGGVVEEGISVKTQYNSCGIGLGNSVGLRVEVGRVFVGPCNVYL